MQKEYLIAAALLVGAAVLAYYKHDLLAFPPFSTAYNAGVNHYNNSLANVA